MTTINKSALVPFSQEEMYQLVFDVDRYKEFLPWCSGSKLLTKTDEYIEGKVWVNHIGFKQSFTTRNHFIKNEKLAITLLDGPFKELEGYWLFEKLDSKATKISLQLDFSFKNKLVSMALGPIFSQIANSMLDSFCKRASSLYS
ncbi:MAG: type II toxin-antitoxin system RatA family toxin [Gammaproteobacteria bacterium]|nr:type II toxin-antitoxin system RatA family toxin [Gammaproteobacteria bacterium]